MRAVTVLRKPLEGTVAQNCLEHGCGAINIDGTRVTGGEAPKPTTAPGWDSINRKNADSGYRPSDYNQGGAQYTPSSFGRWPSNVILHEGVVAELDAQSGITSDSHGLNRAGEGGQFATAIYGTSKGRSTESVRRYAETGTATRFFKQVKK